MDILVTGGAGFIGSHISEALVEEGHSVVVLDTLDPYYDVGIKERNIEICREKSEKEVSGDYEFVEGSITEKETVDDLFEEKEFDYVFHEAAQAGVRTSVENPLKPNKINVEGALNLLMASVENGVERFINASSSSVYGPKDYLPVDEEHPLRPQSPYAVTKVAAEKYCDVFNEIHGLPTVNLRYFTVYGPRMRPNMAISNFVSRCLNDKSPIIYGDGEQSRDFTYIDDIVEANLKLLETDDADGETMNLGSTDNISINELADYVIDVTGSDLESVHEEEKAADVRHTHADVSKASDLIDYSPSTTIREGVGMFVDWYEENKEWYEPLVLNS